MRTSAIENVLGCRFECFIMAIPYNMNSPPPGASFYFLHSSKNFFDSFSFENMSLVTPLPNRLVTIHMHEPFEMLLDLDLVGTCAAEQEGFLPCP